MFRQAQHDRSIRSTRHVRFETATLTLSKRVTHCHPELVEGCRSLMKPN